MAQPGTGFRSVNSLAIEISYHLLEKIVQASITPAVAPGLQTVAVSSAVGVYAGAQIVCDVGTPQEIITIISFTPSTITANFANAHADGALLLAATFPTQQPTDPLFTQSEILSYLSRAQNEFLARVPAIFQLSQQVVLAGELFQTSPANMIEINRVAYSPIAIALSSLVRASGIVTAITFSAHGLMVGQKFSIFGVANGFNGAFKVATVIDNFTFTYLQAGPDAVAVGSGAFGEGPFGAGPFGEGSTIAGYVGLWLRLYERSQEELAMANPNWRNQYIQALRSWYEDRTGNYVWGVAGKPASNFVVELLCAIRDTNTLALTDGFLVPDLMLHGVKYLVLSWAWDKDGEQRSPQMAAYCLKRFESIVMASQRWIDGVLSKV